MSAPFVVLNVQTAVGSALVLEVAAVVLDARGLFELERFSSLIAPSAADKGKAVQHAAITARETQSAPAFEAIAAHLHRIVTGKIWAGHHVELAKSVLPALFARAGLAPVTPVGVLDTVKMFAASPLPPRAGATAAEQQNPSSLPALAKLFGAGECKQRAENDAIVNVEVLRRGGCAFFLERAFPQLFPGGAGTANSNAGSHASSAPALSATAPAFKSLASPKGTGSASASSSILGTMNAASPALAPVAAATVTIPPVNVVIPAPASAPAPAAASSSTKPVSAAAASAAAASSSASSSSAGKPPMSPTKQKPAPAKPASSAPAPAPTSAPAAAAAATAATTAGSKPAAASSAPVAPASPSFTGKARAPPSPLLAKHMPTTEWGLMDEEDEQFSLSPSGAAAFAASVAASSSAAASNDEDAGWETVGAKKETGKKAQPQQHKQRPASAAPRSAKPASVGANASGAQAASGGGSGSGGKKEAPGSPEYIAMIDEAIRTGAPVKFSYQSDNTQIDFKPRTVKALRWDPSPYAFVGVVVLPANASAATVAAKADREIYFSTRKLLNLKNA